MNTQNFLNTDWNAFLDGYLSDAVRPLPKNERDKMAEAMGVKPRYLARILDGHISDPGLSRVQKIIKFAIKNGWTYQPEQNS